MEIYLLVIYTGFYFLFLNGWVLKLSWDKSLRFAIYLLSLSVGYILFLIAGLWTSRLLKNNLMEDVFNTENESFMQEVRLIENEFSVNLPTEFTFQGKNTKDGST